MPTTIDLENAKQIRQSMDVYISVAVEETATLTFSGYGSANVADGELSESTWPMRTLADLQNDGFELDGSAVLYDSTTTASAANGKLGVRSDIGESISLTVTASSTVDYITVYADGAESVTYGGTAYSLTTGCAIIPVGGVTSIALTFTPAETDKRIEISEIEPGIQMNITNDNLISCTVSLRSDLSILEPTLPESEINIEAYFDEDISELLASIPDGTAVTYQAGYDDDLSTVRNFYLAEKITWADNIMTIHAVDAVHKLDVEIGTALRPESTSVVPFAGTLMGFVYEYVGVNLYTSAPTSITLDDYIVIDDGFTARDYIAQVNWLLHQHDNIWYTYVDAGIPKFTHKKPSSSWDIYEYDCGDVQRSVDRDISTLTVKHDSKVATSVGAKIGTANFVKNVGVSLNFDSPYVLGYSIGVEMDSPAEEKISDKYSAISLSYGAIPFIPVTESGVSSTEAYPRIYKTLVGCKRLMKGDLAQSSFSWVGGTSSSYSKVFTQFIPWACTYDTSDSYWTDNPSGVNIRTQTKAWNTLKNAGVITADTTDYDLSICGRAYMFETSDLTFSSGRDGIAVTIDSPPWKGEGTNSTYGTVYPDNAYTSILSRSPVTGSFTWKGDPRMQPRDVATFHRLDGSTEDITLENITITHEGGGTSAEITYRKGVC